MYAGVDRSGTSSRLTILDVAHVVKVIYALCMVASCEYISLTNTGPAKSTPAVRNVLPPMTLKSGRSHVIGLG